MLEAKRKQARIRGGEGMKRRQVDMTGGYCAKARRKVGNPDIRCPLAKERKDVSCSPVCDYWDSVMPKRRSSNAALTGGEAVPSNGVVGGK